MKTALCLKAFLAIKGDGYTWRGDNSVKKVFTSLFKLESTLKKICPLMGKFFPFQVAPFSNGLCVHESKQRSQMLSLKDKLAENSLSVYIPLNGGDMLSV